MEKDASDLQKRGETGTNRSDHPSLKDVSCSVTPVVQRNSFICHKYNAVKRSDT